MMADICPTRVHKYFVIMRTSSPVGMSGITISIMGEHCSLLTAPTQGEEIPGNRVH